MGSWACGIQEHEWGFTTMTELATIAGRVKTSIGGLLFTAISLLFVGFGIAAVVQVTGQAATYLPATATIDKVTGSDDASDKVSVAYSFSVDGKRYTGTESADDEYKARFNELRQFKAGQQLAVYYDPHDPAKSQGTVKADASALAFSIFALPFLRGAEPVVARTDGQGVDPLAAAERPKRCRARRRPVLGFVLACVAGTIGQIALCSVTAWPWSLVAGLSIIFVAIPAVIFWANRLARQWRFAKSVKLREAHAVPPGRPCRGRARRLRHGRRRSSRGRSLSDDRRQSGQEAGRHAGDRGRLVRHHRSHRLFRRRPAGQALLRQFVAFASTQGVVLSSKVKTSHGSKGGSSSHRISSIDTQWPGRITLASNTILPACPPPTTPTPSGP